MEDPNFDAEFYALVGSMEFDGDGVKLLEPIDDKRDEIIDSLVSHLETFGDIDIDDDDELEATLETLHLFVNRDFEKIGGIAFGDDIVASGDTIVILVDPEDFRCDAHNLADDIKLRGKIVGLTIMEIPDISTMARILNPDIEELDEVNLPTNKFGIAFEIENAVIESEYDSEAVPKDKIVFLPLNYPQLHLRRFV